MKKTMLFSSVFVALAMLVSCQKEEYIETPATEMGVTQFTATIEPSTKTSIDDGGKITWVKGDEITITDAASTKAVYEAASSGASTEFNIKTGETPLSDGPYTAIYGDYENQEYSQTGANCPLSAESKTTYFHFSSSRYAVLKITAKSEEEKTIKEVKIISDGSEGSDCVSLDCSNEVVKLSSGGTVFYIAVKPNTFENLEITFNTIDIENKTATKTRSNTNNKLKLEAGDLLPLTLYFSEADWQEPACVAAGTMITMENGEQKAVEEIEIGDMLRTFDHETGNVSSSKVCLIWKTENVSKFFTLTFEDGVEVDIIEEHGFYDKEERKYAFINATNANDYIGHHFYDADKNRFLELKSCKLSKESVDAYAIVTSKHLNHLSNGILSISDGSIKVLANIFEYDEQMKFDADKKKADIEAYGLTPLEKILEYKGFLEADYYDYNLMYLNIAIGKGLTTWDYVQALSDYCEANHIY